MLFSKGGYIRGLIPFNRPKGRGIRPLNTNKDILITPEAAAGRSTGEQNREDIK
ncbi:hypothetical protein AGMMS49579_04840 [Spirochaetia bacterium]|nr:hypothetical protein AGMMS49579_04840 [Spirochaetia bacterium]